MKEFRIACAIVVNKDGDVLLTKRAREPFKGYWALPSGIGESKKGIETAIGVREEVRCDLSTNTFEGKFLFSIPIENDPETVATDVYVGHVNEDELKTVPEFSQGYKWVKVNNTEEFKNLAYEHTKIISKYLRNVHKGI